LNDLYPSSNIF